jgi:hypothetical protein
MHPALKLSFAAFVLVGGTVIATAAALRPQEKEKDEPKRVDLAAPGAPHEELMKHAGTWEQAYKIRMSPDMPWMDAKGTSEAKPLLGGRFLLETVKYDMLGIPIEGVHILGYDNLKQEYTSLWADSMSTWFVSARGQAGPDGAIEMKGTMVDVAGERPFRMVLRPQGDDAMEIEMYDTIPPAGDTKVMTVSSKRRK